MRKTKITVAAAVLVAGMVWQSASPTAADDDQWLKVLLAANGGCINFTWIFWTPLETRSTELYGKPILKWTDNDIEAAVRIFRDCYDKNQAAKIAVCMRTGHSKSECEGPLLSPPVVPVGKFEQALRQTVTYARERYAEKNAQEQAKIEQERIAAENKRVQAQEEARRKELQEQAKREQERIAAEKKRAQAQEEAERKREQLLEQARRDREFAEEARRFAEREEPKIAEATKQAEEARRVRQEAEERLAEIRGRIDAQQKQRQEELTKKREVNRKAEESERQADREEQTSGFQQMSVETFVLDGGTLAAQAAKVWISGSYVREGNLDVLYANMGAVMNIRRGYRQPNTLLSTENASREFRQVLLTCQSNPATTQMGCGVTILGRATTCKLTNAFGAMRDEPCVAVEKGWQ